MRLPLAFSAWVFVSPVAAMAEVLPLEERLAACLSEADSLARLSCFERVARALPVPSPEGQGITPPSAVHAAPPPSAPGSAPRTESASEEQAPGGIERLPSGVAVVRDPDGRPAIIGDWIVSRSVDSLTDRPRVTLLIEGRMEIARTGERRPALLVRCFSGRLEIFWDAGQFIGTSDTFATTLRFDDGQPQQQRWSSSTSGRAVFAPNSTAVMNGLVAARERLLIETVAFSGERYRARFDIAGIRDAAAEVSACWRPPQPAQPRPPGQQQRPSAPR